MSDIQTSTANVSVMQRRMATQQEIEQHLNKLIRDMRGLVDDTNIAKSQMEKHQMSNLLAVALDTPSVEQLKVYIQYQVGRDTGGKSWRFANFGETLAARLHGLETEAKGIVQQVNKDLRITKKPADKDVEAVWIDLARHYVGQLSRYFYYRKG
ncbi:hypothetical protein ACFLXQ_07800 [Chloroflexota bacterium]